MTESELNDLINKITDSIERVFNLPVSQNARKALLTPAIPHLADLTRDLSTGRITLSFLEESLRQVLINAREDVRRRDASSIDEQDIKDSMARYCPYLFWC